MLIYYKGKNLPLGQNKLKGKFVLKYNGFRALGPRLKVFGGKQSPVP
jgi:hypothetical protein